MPTYIMLSKLSEQGLQTLRANPERLREVNKDVEELGARVLHQWFMLGPYDFVNIVDAPDAKTVAQVSVAISSRGSTSLESYEAIDVGELLDLLTPSGTFAHIEHVAPDTPWMAHAFEEAMIDAVWEYGRYSDQALTRDTAAAAYASRLDRDANRLAPLDAQCAWLRDTGYTQVSAPFRWYEIAVFGGYRPA